MKNILLFIVKPYGIVTITVFLSFLSWLIPDSFGFWKGFEIRAEVNAKSLLIFITWYLSIFLFAYGGFTFGTKILLRIGNYGPIELKKAIPFIILSLFAFIGLLASFYSVVNKMGLEGIFLSMIDFSLNSIEEALYDEYSAGIYSLRYAIILVFGLSLFKLYKRQQVPLSIFNIVLFILYTVVFGKRLQILCGLFIFLSLFTSDSELIKNLKTRKLLLNLMIVFLLFIVSSTLRGFNTFSSLGFENPLSATIANVILYLAAPMQGFFTVANNINFDFNTFDFFALGTIDYRLNTNSGFSFIVMSTEHGEFGIDRTFLPYHGYGLFLGYLYIIFISFTYSTLMGFLWSFKRTYYFLAYGVILYSFGEIWRINMFSIGLFYSLVLISLIVPFTILFFNRLKFSQSNTPF